MPFRLVASGLTPPYCWLGFNLPVKLLFVSELNPFLTSPIYRTPAHCLVYQLEHSVSVLRNLFQLHQAGDEGLVSDGAL